LGKKKNGFLTGGYFIWGDKNYKFKGKLKKNIKYTAFF